MDIKSSASSLVWFNPQAALPVGMYKSSLLKV